jgi:prepilin signal peptidase PulO-like enzyme (type II secretory pathway)
MLPVYWTLIGVLVLLCGFLIVYYADPRAALYAKLLVFLSFLASLICFVILPVDIYESSI